MRPCDTRFRADLQQRVVSQRDTLAKVIKSFQHKGLQALFETGTKAGIKADHVDRLRQRLARLNLANGPDAMRLPGYGLHELKGKRVGEWAVKVTGNWRMTFRFDGSDAILVDYLDYH